jgi:hypothetical protein
MITVEFDKKCELPAMSEPSSITWKVKRLKNTTTGETVVNGTKRAYREYRIDRCITTNHDNSPEPLVSIDMRVLEKKKVYDSISDALYGDSYLDGKEKEWLDTTLSFEMVIFGCTDRHSYTYSLVGSNGVIDSVELVEKSPID